MKRFIGSFERATRTGTSPEIHDSCRVLYRGYIANRRELCAEAHRRGLSRESLTDGALFALAYRWWGAELQAHVLGEYALAIFDTVRQTGLATHDALGVMPFFYAPTSEGLTVASHLEDLIPQGSLDLDEEFIADFLAAGRHIGERTPYRGLKQLLPGRTLLWDHGRITIKTTWDLSQVRPLRLSSDAEYEERFRMLLHEGVAAARVAEGPVWSELSGGLDSSSIVCSALKADPTDLSLLSIVYGRTKGADERKWMREVIEQSSIPWHTVDFDECPPFSEIPTEFQAVPSGALGVTALYKRYEELMSAHGARVLLSGIGGDQVMMGDGPNPDYLADSIAPTRLHRLVHGVREWSEKSGEKRSYLHVFLRNAVVPFVHHALDRSSWTRDLPGLAPWLHPLYLRTMSLENRGRERSAPRCRTVAEQTFQDRVWPTFLIGTGRHQLCRSYEIRYPLLYRPLVEFMFSIPAEQTMRPGEDRSLQRHALRGILPERIRNRRSKLGPQQLYHDGLRQSRAWLDLLTDRPRVVERGYVDAARWKEAVDHMTVGRTHGLLYFLGTATLEVWLRQLEQLRRASPTATVKTCTE